MAAKCLAVIKELLDPKSFNSLSYILVVLWLPFSFILPGVFAFVNDATNTNKTKHYRCKSESQDSVQELCHDRYQSKYTISLLYGFWLLNWICISIACVVYNQCVKSRVRELDHEDIERQRTQRLAPSRWLYCAYCCQLIARLVVHILFIILQTTVLYPLKFPATTYECISFESHTSSVEQYVTQTNPTQTHQCENPIAIAYVIVCIVNGSLVACVLLEMIYILSRAKITYSFKLDLNFFQTHIMGKSREPLAVPGYREQMRRVIHSSDAERIEPLIPLDAGEKNEWSDNLNHDFDTVYTKLVICPDRVQYEFTGKERHEILEGNYNNTDENLNLQEWLSSSEYSCAPVSDDVLDYIRNNPDKVICIFDGLDEFSHIINEKSIHSNAMPFSAFYGKLVSGKLLAGATVITTSRTTALSSVGHITFDRTLEILGFTSKQVKEYVNKVVRSTSGIAEQIWQHINGNANLLSLCYIPVNCRIMCECLLYYIQHTTSVTSLPATLTEIYLQAMKVVICKHNSEYRGKTSEQNELLQESGTFMSTVKNSLMTLGQLALKGISEQRLIFESKEVVGLEQCGTFLHRLPGRETGPFKTEPQFCFIHMTMQEFISSWYIVETYNDEELKEFVTRAITEGKWLVVIQFVAGLLHDRAQTMVTMFTDLLPDTGYEYDGLNLWPIKKARELVLVLFKCIFEIAAGSSQVSCRGWTSAVSEKMQLRVLCIRNLSVTDADIAAVVFVLLQVNIDFIDFSYNLIEPTGCFDICKLLSNDECKLITLDIASNKITDVGAKHLANALSKNKCKLTTLNINGNQITYVGAEYLCNTLSMDECKLTTLDIGGNQITYVGVEHLSNALSKDECKLTTLDISSNKITDVGAEHLSNALSKDECKLITLNINNNKITDVGVKHLSNTLFKDECKLTTLNISWNHITDVGAKHLSNALSKDECKLTTLNISVDQISDVGIEHLSNALSKDKCKLTTLNLDDNQITDVGIEHLSNALSKDECKLTILYISSNQISDVGVEHLSDALSKDECKLTTLNINNNLITDVGVEHLSNALSKDECKLTTLNINNNLITDVGVKHLSNTLSKDECKLTTLNIFSINEITDVGVEHLSNALSNDECKLTTLDISGNQITDVAAEHLSNALSKDECKLTTLEISDNEITDVGAKHLCNALSKDECKLKTLYICRNHITDVGAKHLSNALSKDECKLTTLDISNNRITDVGVGYLCNALSNDECKLTT